jgi:hypothetical protein
VKRFFLLISHPVKGADLLSSNASWIGQCVLLLAVGVVIHAASYSRIVQLTVDHLPASATQADRQAMTAILDGQRWVSAAFLPFRMLGGFSGSALLLYFSIRAVSSGGGVHFGDVMALEVHAEPALLLGNLVASAAVFTGIQQNPYVNPFGIDQIFQGKLENLAASNSINPFTLWYCAILALGIARMFKMRYWKAIVAVMSTWVITFVMQESALDLLRNFFHFRT